MDAKDEEVRATAVALRRAATRLSLRIRAERPSHGPSRLGLSLLGHLYRRGPLTAGELAAAESLQPQSLTRVLASLERKGLINRTRTPDDRRRHRIALTDSGRSLLADQVRDADAWLTKALTEKLSPTERGLLHLAVGLLDHLLDDGPGRRPAS
jgi:DNA-binding MarR family transcriptional regulator